MQQGPHFIGSPDDRVRGSWLSRTARLADMLRAASSAGRKRKQSEASSSTDVLPMAELGEEDTRLTDLCARWPGRQAECTRLFDLLEEAPPPARHRAARCAPS